MKKLISIILVLLAYSTSSFGFFSDDESKCEKLKWTKVDSRTQGGGWIWFPGKATGENLAEAHLKAEGLAIERLMQECKFPHKEVQIHERCDEKLGKFHKAYVRVSIKQKFCKETKYASPEREAVIRNMVLTKTYNRYKRLISKSTRIGDDLCNSTNHSKCHSMGKYEFHMENNVGALKYFDIGCLHGNMDSCFNAGLAAKILSDTKRAIGYFKLTCRNKKKQDPEGCYFLGKLYGADSNALKYYKTACLSGIGKACFEASKIQYDNGSAKNALASAKNGCDLKHPKSCYNAGFLNSKNKNSSESNLYFYKQACKLQISQGCLKAAENSPKKLKFYLQACKLKHKKGCKEASVMYYDLKNIGKSLRYSKIACNLGDSKSCKNINYLSKKLTKSK